MSEPNWIARIIVLLLAALVVGVLVGGYIIGNRPPPRQHMEQAVPNDKLPG